MSPNALIVIKIPVIITLPKNLSTKINLKRVRFVKTQKDLAPQENEKKILRFLT